MTTEELAEQDRALIDRVAARVVELRLETPAILAIESSRPLSVVAGQAMLFFEPFAQMLFRLPDYRRFAELIERRDVLSLLVERLETLADAREQNRRTNDAARTPPKANP